MKFRKTSSEQRETYKYYDANGKLVVELEPGINGVTELDILECHRADDREVTNNLKNWKPKLTDEEKQVIKDWEERTGQEWTEKNYNLSFDALAPDEGCNDKSKLWHQVFNRHQESEEIDPMIERLREVVLLLTPEQQELYQLVYIEEIPQVQIAKELGITKQALQSKINKIKARIKKLF